MIIPPLRALAGPSQEEVLEAAQRLARARLHVRDLPSRRSVRRAPNAIRQIELASQAAARARDELSGTSGDERVALTKELARAQLTELVLLRRHGFRSKNAYRQVCHPRTSFISTALRHHRIYRELGDAEMEWSRVCREVVQGELVIDLTDSAQAESEVPVTSAPS